MLFQLTSSDRMEKLSDIMAAAWIIRWQQSYYSPCYVRHDSELSLHHTTLLSSGYSLRSCQLPHCCGCPTIKPNDSAPNPSRSILVCYSYSLVPAKCSIHAVVLAAGEEIYLIQDFHPRWALIRPIRYHCWRCCRKYFPMRMLTYLVVLVWMVDTRDLLVAALLGLLVGLPIRILALAISD